MAIKLVKEMYIGSKIRRKTLKKWLGDVMSNNKRKSGEMKKMRENESSGNVRLVCPTTNSS